MKKILLLALIALGCHSTSPTPPSLERQKDFIPYVGKQPDWPVAPGAFAKTVKGVAIYARDQYPAQPYDILARVNTANMARVIFLAKLSHADAAILVSARNPFPSKFGTHKGWYLVKYKNP